MTVEVAFRVDDRDHTIELEDDYPNATYRKGEQIVTKIEALGYQWTTEPPTYSELANWSRQSGLARIEMGDISDRLAATSDSTVEE